VTDQLTQAELDKLNSANTEDAWNAACDEIKAAHGGYPPDWYPRVVMGGIMDRAQARFR
jgi:hypothetical protein